MAVHDGLPGVFKEAVEDYLTAAKLCIEYQKEDLGILGYPAALILFCLVDAMGGNLKREEKHKLRYKGDFQMFCHPALGLNLSDPREQIPKLANWYRNKLAHGALLAPNTLLRGEENSEPFSFLQSGEPTAVFLKPFYRVVKDAWDALGMAAFDHKDEVKGPDIDWPNTPFSPPPSGAIKLTPPTREEIEQSVTEWNRALYGSNP